MTNYYLIFNKKLKMEIIFENCQKSEKIFGDFLVDFNNQKILEKLIHTIFSENNIENVEILCQEYLYQFPKSIILTPDNLISLIFCWMWKFHKNFISLEELSILCENPKIFTSLNNFSETLINFEYLIKNSNLKFMKKIVSNNYIFFKNNIQIFLILCIKNNKNNLLKYFIKNIYLIDSFIDDLENKVHEYIYDERTLFEILLSFSMRFKNTISTEYLLNLKLNVFLSDLFFDCLIENGDYHHPFDILRINLNQELSLRIINFLFTVFKKVENLVLSTKNYHIIHSFYLDINYMDKNFMNILNSYVTYVKQF